jgi:hypothetical protein
MMDGSPKVADVKDQRRLEDRISSSGRAPAATFYQRST